MKYIKYLFFSFFAVVGNSYAQQNLIPQPQQIDIKSGNLYLDRNFSIVGKGSPEEAKFLQKNIKEITGLELPISSKDAKKSIILNLDAQHTAFSNEGYELIVAANQITITANQNRGIFYGIQTLLQLIEENRSSLNIPLLLIQDAPKFAYRGMHLDVSRHFFSTEEVKQYLDYLAAYKINKFHWHLTDDQGWRIEIKSHPKLTEVGAFRKESQTGPYAAMTFDGKPYGGFYTQEQIKDVVAYAQALHIEVIPEIEMPGHAQAVLAAYPELSCTGGPFEVGTTWGVMDDIFCPKDETFALLEDVIDEVITLFPSKYIHIGGDEAPKTRWKSCPHCQELIKKEGLTDELELQSYFITRMEKYINEKGKSIIGWDEILEGGLAPNATVMSWTGIQGGIHAAKTGHDAIMTPTSHLYFDYYQGNPQTEPLAFGGDTRLDKVYSFNPIPSELSAEEAKHILGPQANMWTEYITNFKQVQHMLFPRLMALSEVAWGTSKPDDYKKFESRVIQHLKVLDRKGINYSKAIYEVIGNIKLVDGQLTYTLSTANDPKHIRYTIDGSEPSSASLPYVSPINIDQSQTIKATYFENGKPISATITQSFDISKSTGKNIRLVEQPGEAYSTGGASTLIDGVFGDKQYFGKNWLGFNGKDVNATIDFGKETEFSTVKLSSLDRKGSWIHFPKEVRVSISKDGSQYEFVKGLSQAEIIDSDGDLVVTFPVQNARYIKVEVLNLGIIPDGQAGAGSGAWLFVDEISVN
ncbi:glycoside hydrolase family 20 protein [Sphingobacterium lumbrici]|uniref:glycoside hydrolase family 20 protein n=1 Tax=Sphingobacterium lumbrici TaxID=2559600 RepID=UPI00112D1FC4|nr:family 20 glycosylhydrolase [Sphingobacterium lumbrici]